MMSRINWLLAQPVRSFIQFNLSVKLKSTESHGAQQQIIWGAATLPFSIHPTPKHESKHGLQAYTFDACRRPPPPSLPAVASRRCLLPPLAAVPRVVVVVGGDAPAWIRRPSALLPGDRVRGRGRGHRDGALLLLRGVGAEAAHGPRAPVADRRATLLCLQRSRLWSRLVIN